MYDMRIAVLNGGAGIPITVSADGTLTGDTIDLKNGYTGSYFEGAPAGYGIGVKVFLTSITGTAFTVEIYWETSSDNSTWVRDALVYPATDVVAAVGTTGTKVAVTGRLRTTRRYARLKVVSASMSGESFVVKAYASDGTGDQNGVPVLI